MSTPHRIQLDTPDGTMALDERRNIVRDRGAVILFHEMTGVNEHIFDVLGRLSAAGYHAVVPHLFHRTGDPTFAYGDHEPIMEQVATLDDKHFLMDIDATLDYLQNVGWSLPSIGAVGFSIGGRVSFLLAVSRAVGASVGFYGGGIAQESTRSANTIPSLIPRAGSLQTPWLGMFGDADGGIPVADVERLRTALKGREAEIVRYPGAPHAFHCDPRPEFRPAAAWDAWKRTLAWFEEHLQLRYP